MKKTTSIISTIVIVALTTCLTCAFTPMAYASNTQLTAGAVKTAKATTVKKAHKPNKVRSLKVASKKSGKATITWKAPKKVKGVKVKSYTVRYAYNKAMKSAKAKTVKAKKLTLSKLKQGKKLYVQVRTNAKYGKKTVRSKWSAKKAVTVKKTTASKTKKQSDNPAVVTMPTNLALSAGNNAGEVKATWSSKFAQGSFDVRYAYNSNMSNAQTKTIDNKSTGTNSLLLKNLTHLKNIYVQVRYKSNGTVSNWTSAKSIKVPGTWVEEQGHWEPVYTTVVDQEAYTTYTRLYIAADGYTSTDGEAFDIYCAERGLACSWEDIPEEHPAITHQEQTGQKWVVDVPGHWE